MPFFNKQNIAPYNNRCVCFSATIWLTFYDLMLQLCGAFIFFPWFGSWVCGVIRRERCQKKEKHHATSFNIRPSPSQQKKQRVRVSSVLFFNSDFVLFHLQSGTFPPLSSVQIGAQMQLRDSDHPSTHCWASERQRKREIMTHGYIVSASNLCLSAVPIVSTTKMMTATPSSIAKQLSSMERRPYFLAPAISPVWRTELD